MEYLDTTEYKELADEEVLARSIDDPEAFGILVERYEAAFMRAALRVVRNPEDAREVVQDALIKIYAAAPRFRTVPGASFKSWGYTILLNTAKTRYQKMKRERTHRIEIDPEWYEVLPDPENAHDAHVFREDLLVALAKLPEHMSRILALQFLEGKSQAEIAEAEAISVGAVKTRVHRAKQELKKVLSHHSAV